MSERNPPEVLKQPFNASVSLEAIRDGIVPVRAVRRNTGRWRE